MATDFQEVLSLANCPTVPLPVSVVLLSPTRTITGNFDQWLERAI